MMGHQQRVQTKLFYTKLNLEQRIRKDHILRKIAKHIDFDFIYKEVKDKYGSNGNISVPLPVILKMMFLLIFYNVRSERELMITIPERLDWLWFLGYDLDDEVPDHSVLSKARARWGVEAFKTFFEQIVFQCVEADLVDGSKIFMDSSMVQADASNNSVVNKESLKRYLNKSYKILESRLGDDAPKSGTVNRKYISTTDIDASVTRRGKGRSKLRYQTHRGTDERCEVITATEVTPGEVHEAHRFESIIDTHQNNTGRKVETAVADSKYGTIKNYLACHDRGIKPHFKSVEETRKDTGTKKGIFSKEAFTYDADNDLFICPAGQILKKCTRSKSGRTLKRHVRQDDLDKMLKQAISYESKKDIKTRQHLMERSFARSDRYGFKRARWRRLWRVQIQEYLISTIQNIMTLLRYMKEPGPAVALSPL